MFTGKALEILNVLESVQQNHHHPIHDRKHPQYEESLQTYRALEAELIVLTTPDEF